MADNSTSIVISARDETRAAFDSVSASLNGLNALAARLPGPLGAALGVGATGATFTAIVTSSIDAMAKLHDLSIQSNATVESLSGMKLAAKLAGIEIDDVAKMAQKLSISLGEAKLKGGDKAKLFEALGIDPKSAKDSGQALFELAKTLDGMTDKTKALAIARELLGKSVSMVFLNELAQQEQLIAKVTTAQARLADEFKDNMVRMRSGASQIGMALANEVLPAMNDVVRFSLRVKEEWGAIAGILFGLGGGSVLKLMGVELDETKRATQATAEAFKDLAAARAKLENTQAGAAQNSILPGVNDLRAALVRSAQKDVEEAERRLQSAIAGQRRVAAESAAEAARLKKKPVGIDLPDNLLGSASRDKFDPYEEYIRLAKLAEDEWAAIIKQRSERQKEANRDFDETLAAQDRLLDADRALIKSAREQNEATQMQIDLYGQSAAVIEARVKMLEFERLGIERGTEAWQARYDLELRNSEATESLKKLNDETKKGEEFARSMGMTFTSAFEDAVISGKSLGDVLKGLAQDVARVFLRKTVTEPVGSFFADVAKKFLPSFDVGTPYVPQDMVAVVHKGEAIIPAEYNRGGGGAVTVNLIEAPGKGGQVRQRSGRDGRVLDVTVESIKAAVAQDIMRGAGPVPAAMQAAYGLGRVGSA